MAQSLVKQYIVIASRRLLVPFDRTNRANSSLQPNYVSSNNAFVCNFSVQFNATFGHAWRVRGEDAMVLSAALLDQCAPQVSPVLM